MVELITSRRSGPISSVEGRIKGRRRQNGLSDAPRSTATCTRLPERLKLRAGKELIRRYCIVVLLDYRKEVGRKPPPVEPLGGRPVLVCHRPSIIAGRARESPVRC